MIYSVDLRDKDNILQHTLQISGELICGPDWIKRLTLQMGIMGDYFDIYLHENDGCRYYGTYDKYDDMGIVLVTWTQTVCRLVEEWNALSNKGMM